MIILKKYKFDILLIIGLLAVGVLLLVLWLTSIRGVVGTTAYVSRNGEEILKIDLKYNNTYEINGTETKMVIEVKDGHLSVTSSGCPDKICVHHESISRVGEEIICIPNKVIIRVVE